MTLRADNCTVQIEDNQIFCEYTYLFDKKINWTILLTNKIEYADDSTKKTFDNDNIQEFLFEVQTDGKRAHKLTQVAVAYIIEKTNPEPKELFRLCVKEEIKLTSETKSYKFAESVLKSLSERFSIPYSFKFSISTRKKTKTFSWSTVIVLATLLLGMLIGLWETLN